MDSRRDSCRPESEGWMMTPIEKLIADKTRNSDEGEAMLRDTISKDKGKFRWLLEVSAKLRLMAGHKQALFSSMKPIEIELISVFALIGMDKAIISAISQSGEARELVEKSLTGLEK